jgi:hypothetical protein
MCTAVDEAPGFIDAATGKDMEDLLDKEEVKKGIMEGKYKPLTIDHVYHLYSGHDEKEGKSSGK